MRIVSLQACIEIKCFFYRLVHIIVLVSPQTPDEKDIFKLFGFLGVGFIGGFGGLGGHWVVSLIAKSPLFGVFIGDDGVRGFGI